MPDIFAFYSKTSPFDRWHDALQPLLGEVVMQQAHEVSDPTQVKYIMAWLPPTGFFDRFPNAELLINFGAGVDRFATRDDVPDLPVVRLVDPGMAQMMTSYAVFSVLRHARDIPHFEAAQRRGEWDYLHPRHASDITVAVLGLGELGARAATEIARHGFDTHGWATRPRDLPGITVHSGAESLPGLLARADIVLVLLPLTSITRGMFDAETFATMKPNAAFINLARGALVDEAALVSALRSGHLSGATLDVFEQEPLPGNHPLWTLPQVLITPHLAAVSMPETAAEQIAHNIHAFREGRPLINQVSLARGY